MREQKKRIRQALSKDEIIEVLNRNSSGVLSLLDENNNPYGVPLNYTYIDGKLVFHSSKFGYKIDLIKKNSKCSFTVIDCDKVVKEDYTSLYRSVIICGDIHIIEDKDEILKYINIFTDKFVPLDENREAIIMRNMNYLSMLVLDINQWSGKCALDLVK